VEISNRKTFAKWYLARYIGGNVRVVLYSASYREKPAEQSAGFLLPA
jgi:hypothetical protein